MHFDPDDPLSGWRLPWALLFLVLMAVIVGLSLVTGK